jgi:hypothetical protein
VGNPADQPPLEERMNEKIKKLENALLKIQEQLELAKEMLRQIIVEQESL